MIGWRHVFTIACAVLYACSIFYMIFASGELQSWSTGIPYTQKLRLTSEKLPPLLAAFQHNLQENIHLKKQENKSLQPIVNSNN